jgi:hypothetical protein
MPTPIPKYELLRDQVRHIGLDQRVFRIRALRDIPEHKVRAGDLGGFVESERNLSQHGAAWIADDAMAIGGSHVEDDALLRGDAHMSGHAILQQKAVLERYGRATDRAVVGGEARMANGAVAEGSVLVAGDVVVRHPVVLGGDAVIRRQEDVPWALRHADPREPDYEPRLREAVALDPAFHRAFVLLGAGDEDARQKAVDELLDGPAVGRKALHDIARTLGGTFHSDRYEPRSSTDLASDTSLAVRVQASLAGITNFRHLQAVHEEGAIEAPSGGRLLSGVVAVETRDPGSGEPRSFHQPALLHEVATDPPTLSPVSGRVLISPEVYNDYTSASLRARDLLRLATPSAHGAVTETLYRDAIGAPADARLDHLPFVARAQAVEDDDWLAPSVARIAVQAVAESPSGPGRSLGLREPRGHLVIEVGKRDGAQLDLAEVVSRSGLRFRPTVEAAHRAVEPIYSGRADLVARLTHDTERAADPSRRVRAGEALLVRLIDADHPPQPSAAPQLLTEETIRAALKPLDWRNAPNVFGVKGVGPYHDDAFEAESLRVLFIAEDQGDGTWSLYVEPSDRPARERERAGGYVRPLHREDGLASLEAAMDAAEDHRAGMIAAELEGPDQGLRFGQNGGPAAARSAEGSIELAAVFREGEAEDGPSFRAGRATLRHGRLAFTVEAEAHSSLDLAAEAAIQRLRRPPTIPDATIHLRQPIALTPGA